MIIPLNFFESSFSGKSGNTLLRYYYLLLWPKGSKEAINFWKVNYDQNKKSFFPKTVFMKKDRK